MSEYLDISNCQYKYLKSEWRATLTRVDGVVYMNARTNQFLTSPFTLENLSDDVFLLRVTDDMEVFLLKTFQKYIKQINSASNNEAVIKIKLNDAIRTINALRKDREAFLGEINWLKDNSCCKNKNNPYEWHGDSYG